MVTKTVYSRNKGTGDQAWIYLNYHPTKKTYFISAGYTYLTSDSKDWFSEEQEYDLNEYLEKFPEWKPRIIEKKEEIESEQQ